METQEQSHCHLNGQRTQKMGKTLNIHQCTTDWEWNVQLFPGGPRCHLYRFYSKWWSLPSPQMWHMQQACAHVCLQLWCTFTCMLVCTCMHACMHMYACNCGAHPMCTFKLCTWEVRLPNWMTGPTWQCIQRTWGKVYPWKHNRNKCTYQCRTYCCI